MPNTPPAGESEDDSVGMREALRRIEKARRNGEIVLNLSNLGLTSVPEALWELTTLQRLRLEHNQLRSVPEALGHLKALQRLRLDKNQLTSVPEALWQLTALRTLCLHNNHFTSVSEALGKLTQLRWLTLDNNQLKTLPEVLWQLTSLRALRISSNQLTSVPEALGQLTALRTLSLFFNQLTSVPEALGQLTALRTLSLSFNRLTSVPEALGQLTALRTLSIDNNQLTSVPEALGQLTVLRTLRLENNPRLADPPPQVVGQGTAAILRYLQAKLQATRTLWQCKALIVGEGNVGKTWLYEALDGRIGGGNRKDSGATVGIQIGALNVPHPQEAGVTMTLHCWDFAGQEQNFATHQFFFSEQALILLVWDMRGNYDGTTIRKWLGNLRDRAPGAKVILVGTQSDQPHGSYPKEDLRKDFPQIIHTCEVSSVTGEGIEALKVVMQREAAKLPTMGQEWPETWWKGAEALGALAKQRPHMGLAEVQGILKGEGVDKGDMPVLLKWLHELGNIVHYTDPPELTDKVVLDAQWLTGCIGRVLASNEVAKQKGILTRNQLAELWLEIDELTRGQLLAIMDHFDLAYEIPEDAQARCLVVEKLPQDSAPYEQEWDSFSTCPQLRLRYKLKDLHQASRRGSSRAATASRKRSNGCAVCCWASRGKSRLRSALCARMRGRGLWSLPCAGCCRRALWGYSRTASRTR